MMSADECRAKAEELSRAADAATSYTVILTHETMAREWRWLAGQAARQDAWRRRNPEALGSRSKE